MLTVKNNEKTVRVVISAYTISVVIPAYNEEKLLPQCLESLKNQDCRGDYEIIVADNGSADGTARVAAEFGARVVSCSRKGVAYARQAGAAAASGDIIVQADADTVYPANWLSRITRHFASQPESVALAGIFVYQNQAMPRWARAEYSAKYLINQTGRLILGRPVLVSGANFAFRREVFLKTNGYQPEALYPDQWGISRSLSQLGRVSYDRTLLVLTSSRRVQRPFLLILGDIIRNTSHVLAHFINHEANLLKPVSAGLRLFKTPAKWTTWTLLIVTACLIFGYIASPKIIEALSREGYRFVPIPELLKAPAGNQR